MTPLYKSTIIIWSKFDPLKVELDDLAREACIGEAYCSKMIARLIEDPTKDPDWDSTEFFGDDDNDLRELNAIK